MCSEIKEILFAGYMQRLRTLRQGMSTEQYKYRKRQTGVGQQLHTLYGMHMPMSAGGCGVRQGQYRQAEVYMS